MSASELAFAEVLKQLGARIQEFSTEHDLELTCDFVSAPAADVDRCEREIGVKFPTQLRQLYTSFSDGGREPDSWNGFFGGDEFNSLSNVVAAHHDHATTPEYETDDQGWWSDTLQVKQVCSGGISGLSLDLATTFATSI